MILLTLVFHAHYNCSSSKTTSPLLQLPNEVLNLIVHFALCGETFYITPRARPHGSMYETKHPLNYRVCTCKADDYAQVKEIKSGKEPDRERHTHLFERCEAGLPDWHNRFAVLQTCHQVRKNRALLPYTGNRFVFHSFLAMKTFVQLITIEQANAIQDIVAIHEDNVAFDFRPETLGCKQAMEALRGLKKLLLCFPYPYPVRSYGNFYPLEHDLSRYKLKSYKLATPTLKTASVLLFSQVATGSLRIPHPIAREWERALEEKLLPKVNQEQNEGRDESHP